MTQSSHGLLTYFRPFGQDCGTRLGHFAEASRTNADTSGNGRIWPAAGSGVRLGSLTVRPAEPRCPDTVAEIVAEPSPRAVTSPADDTLATLVLSESQVAEFVRSSTAPFVSVALAVNCPVAPCCSSRLGPETATVTTVGAVPPVPEEGDAGVDDEESLEQATAATTRTSDAPQSPAPRTTLPTPGR
jgi:hypothetical protein